MRFRIGFAALSVTLLLLSCVTGVPEDEVAQIYFNLGNSYHSLGKEKEAGDAFAEAWKLDPTLFQAGYNLARLHLEAGRLAAGRDLIQELLEEDGENTLLLEVLAWSYSLEGRADEALKIYSKILSLYPRHVRSLYNSAVLFRDGEDWESARDAYWNLYTLDPGAAISLSREELLREVALLEIKRENYPAAMEHFEYLALESPSSLGLERLGWLYQREKLYAKALEAYDQALEGVPPQVSPDEAGSLKGRILFEKAFILLTVVEDEEAGFESLSSAIDEGATDESLFERLLGSEGFRFTEELKELMDSKGIGEDKGEDSEEGGEAPVEEPLPPLE